MNIFLSYKWEDRSYVNGLAGLLQNPNNQYRHIPLNEREDYRNKGRDAVKNYLKGLINECDAIICLVGENTHTSEWVSYEMEVGRSLNKKILAVRIKGSKGGLPAQLRSWGIQETNWDSQLINNALSV